MKHQTTLFCNVGRASRPILTVPSDADDVEARLASAEASERGSLVAGGNATDRISFHREVTDIPEAEAPVKPKKGKG
jgi:hypothetical protein